MDIKCKGITWVGNICQKLETMFLEVDEIMCQEPVKYVENHLQTVGANVKQFCSEFVQDVFPPSSVDSVKAATPELSQVQNTDSVAYKMLKVNIIEEPKMELGNVNHLLHPPSLGSVKEDHFNLSLDQSVDIGMYEKLKVDAEENPRKEQPCQSEMSEVDACAENDPSMASLFCGLHHANCDKERDSQAQMSTPISVELAGCESSMKAGEINSSIVDVSAALSSTLPSSSSVILVESCEYKVPDIGLTPGDSLSAESIEGSDGSIAEETRGDDVTKLGMESIQPFNKAKLDESCIVVDGNELCSVFPTAGKHMSYKKKLQQAFASRMRLAKKWDYEQQSTRYGDLEAGSNLQIEKIPTSSTLISNLGSPNNDFCESEWEII
ncbi:hypothetical protein L1049_009850 [Liquidambar formosana]|uniref:Uncharacterized protein n=1 Tax=Liquidambar formosana TaxID=63359 RepID=A0AAP0NAC0_LIQFO